MKQLISFVVPAHNEASGIDVFYSKLKKSIPLRYRYEIIFVNDGSKDETLNKLKIIKNSDPSVRIISFSRNFGKEAATTAGIIESKGSAVIIMDADGQHPVEIIDSFIRKWESGAQVVVGLRQKNKNEGFIKKYGSKFFYKIFNFMAKDKIIPNSTDYRLISNDVRDAFKQLGEHSRITRALIDWLGFKREYINFTANSRDYGEATYSNKKLIKLAMDSFVSLTSLPLFISGYLGLVIIPFSTMLGIFLLIEQYALNDPLSLKITGSAYLGILIVFLVGVILACQGLIALYISRVYEESKGRPLYIINKNESDII